ncbi:MAG: Type 1 glutamine amidotransferase-like domain-containing protein [Actinomycetota bacterium]
MNGPIALIGGWVHSLPCLPVDHRLIELVGKERPVVTIVPVAASRRMLPKAVRTGRRFWEELGAEVRVAVPNEDEPQEESDALEGTDIVVLTGGYPVRLRSGLSNSPLWTKIQELWARGAAVSGSSAGCMELCEWTLRLKPPNPLALVPGLGLIKNCVSLPHFNRYGIARLSPSLLRLADLTLIGVDEKTGLIGAGDDYEVVGVGAVTIIRNGAAVRYPSGAGFELTLAPAEDRPI